MSLPEPPFGIDQPPAVFVLGGAEEAGCFELRPGSPAAVLIPAAGTGMLLEIRGLGLSVFEQFLFRVRFAGPVAVDLVQRQHVVAPRPVAVERLRDRRAHAARVPHRLWRPLPGA